MANIMQFEQPLEEAPGTGIKTVDPVVTHSDGIPIVVSTNIPSGSIEVAQKEIESLPLDYYSQFLSVQAKERKPNPIRGLYPLESRPGLISLLAGKPNPTTFPFTSLDFTARSPYDSSLDIQYHVPAEDLASGLQYGATAGAPGLCEWFYGLQEISHNRMKGEGWRLSIGTGSQDLIFKAINSMVNDGDAVLLETPMYAGVIPMFTALHCEMIEVPTDSHGISSSSLRSTLENWPSGKPKPKVLYTVPYGCNPTGMTATTDRRKEVLSLAREHNFIILEDDPYFYLYYGKDTRYPSYFQLELEQPEVGRVLRFDSLSKILSSGIRIGFVSGPEPLVQAIDLQTATANLQSSSLTQVISLTLLKSWGYDGFIAHTLSVSKFYKEKRDIFESAMQRHLKGLAEWCPPEAGMFYWFKLKISTSDDTEGDSETIIRSQALERGVLALPGTVFLPNGAKTAFVRAAFSLATPEEVDEAVKRFRDVVLDARAHQ